MTITDINIEELYNQDHSWQCEIRDEDGSQCENQAIYNTVMQPIEDGCLDNISSVKMCHSCYIESDGEFLCSLSRCPGDHITVIIYLEKL